MQTYSQTFAGAGAWELNVPGKYFALIACTFPVTVTLYKGGKKLDLGEMKGFLGGLECTLGDLNDDLPAFDRAVITTSTADTVTVGIGNGQARYNRGGGDVNVVNSAGMFTNNVITVTTASAVALAANASRRYLLIQNKDPGVPIYVNFGAAVTAGNGGNGIKIPAGGSYEAQGFCSTQAVHVIGDAANSNIVMVSGQ